MKMRYVAVAEVERRRLAMAVSKAELCRRAGIAYSTYKYVQSGRAATELVAAKLAKALEVQLDEISAPVEHSQRRAS